MAREKTAYEKMFEDGSAYKPIKIDQPSPDDPGGGGNRGGGDPNGNVDYSLYDAHMKDMLHEKIEAKKAAAESPTRPDAPPAPFAPLPQGGANKIARLEKRIELLEQAIGLVMETQTKLMRG